MPKTTLILGDLRGSNIWRKIVEKETFDRIIFTGNYFDPEDPNITITEQIDNFIDLTVYKQDEKKEVILLMGNNDFHYLGTDGPYPGYQIEHEIAIGHLISVNLGNLQIAIKDGDILVTHAGVTNTWLKCAGYTGEANLDDFINMCFKYRPQLFHFQGKPGTMGESIEESPIWVGPKSLLMDAYHYGKLTQIVGHTKVKKIHPFRSKFWFINTLATSGQYVVMSEVIHGTKIFTTEHVKLNERETALSAG